jgi:UDP-N-acetylmuramate--alanine ligase
MKQSDPIELDLTQRTAVHVVGVAGHGMSSLALVLAGMGHRVSGSDGRDLPVLNHLRARGIEVFVGQRAEQVAGADVLAVSTAIPESNVEVRTARAAGIPVVHRSKVLGAATQVRPCVAIAGTHGKTTSASMLSLACVAAGLDPALYLGAEAADLGTGGRWGDGPFVVEADESDGTFLELRCAAALLTNVEPDHLDHWGSVDGLHAAFDTFLGRVEGPRVVCADDAVARRIGGRHGARTYGFSPDADVVITERRPERAIQHLTMRRRGEHRDLVTFALPLRGEHMALNSAGVVTLAAELGIDVAATADALARFGGVARRFEVRGRIESGDPGAPPIVLVDDYAHLPSEIAAVLRAARTSGDPWTRIVAVFQPNRPNRMVSLSPAYADSFVDADVVVVADVYPSGETPIPGVTGDLVVRAVRAAHPDLDVHSVSHRSDLAAAVDRLLRPGDLCLSMGCGDVESLPDEILERRR